MSFWEVKMMRRSVDFIFNDANVAVDVRDAGQPFVERCKIAEPVHGFNLPAAHELFGQRNTVDSLAALVEIGHSAEDTTVFLERKIVGFEHRGDVQVKRVVEEDGAEHHPLGLQVGRQPSFQSQIGLGLGMHGISQGTARPRAYACGSGQPFKKFCEEARI